jgi:hypothetical protein
MAVVVAFDIEYDNDKILCACTAWSNGMVCVPQLWSSGNRDGFTTLQQSTYDALLDSLWDAHMSGCIVLTWGGTGSDWPVMLKNAKTDEQKQKIKILARESVDIPLISVAANGMMMGLVPAAVGMGMGLRPSCDSEDVPRFWNSGNPARQNEVLEHVVWDCKTLSSIYFKLYFSAQHARPTLQWITQKSGPRSVRLQRISEGGVYRLPCVKETMRWPEPQANFEIPAHLHPKKLTEWLRTAEDAETDVTVQMETE